jgi:hypothetical protein
MRSELEWRLDDLSNPLIQWRCWIKKEPYPGFPDRVFDMTETVNTLLDDLRMGDGDESVEEALGMILKTSEEVEAIKQLANALIAVIDATGKTAPAREKLIHPLWADVLTTAREAMDAYCRAEFEVFPPVKPQE